MDINHICFEGYNCHKKQIKISTVKMSSSKMSSEKAEFPLASILSKVQQQQQMDPQHMIRAVSMIFVDPEQTDNKKASFSPQARIILLTILLICTVLGMYTIFESFLDTIILAVLSGVAYVRLRMRFVAYLRKTTLEEVDKKALVTVVFQNMVYLLIIVFLPWIRYEFTDDSTYEGWTELFYARFRDITFEHIMIAFPKSNNIIKMVQIYFLWKFITNIFGNAIQKIFFSFKRVVSNLVASNDQIDRQSRKNQKNKITTFLHQLFFVAFLLMLFLMIIVAASIIFELSSIIGSVGKTIERRNNCTFYALDSDSTHIEQCTEVITGTLKPYLYQYSYQDPPSKSRKR